MNDIYDCQQYPRVSDFSVFERYPGVPVDPPDTRQPPKGQVSGLQGDTVEQWMSCPDVQNAALERAKVYLSNAKIDRHDRWKKTTPQLVSRFELGLAPADELRQWDLPVRFSNISGTVELWRADHNGSSIRADSKLVVQEKDVVETASDGTATIVFADSN